MFLPLKMFSFSFYLSNTRSFEFLLLRKVLALLQSTPSLKSYGSILTPPNTHPRFVEREFRKTGLMNLINFMASGYLKTKNR